MASGVKSLSEWQKNFVGQPIAELSEDHLPTLGEIFRLIHYHRQSSHPNESHRNNALFCTAKCIEVWTKFGIPTALEHNITRKLVKLLKLFKAVHCQSGNIRKRNEILWRRKLQVVFNVSARKLDVKKFRGKKRQILLNLEKEAEELEEFEKSVRVKKILDDFGEMSKATAVDGIVKEHEGSENKIESAKNAENTMKRCKVMLSRMGATTDSDEKPTETQSANVISSAMDIQPEEEDIVPPNLPSIIIKEEIVIDWDENANLYNSFEDFDKYQTCR